MSSVQFKKIYEQNMDLLILEECIADPNFTAIFLKEVGLSADYTAINGIHSYSDADGESDITLILQYPHERVALLIEDKIDAPVMPQQSARYQKRGQSGKDEGLFERFFVILAAPNSYVAEHAGNSGADYPHHVSYERLLEHFEADCSPRSQFKAEMIRCALEGKKRGYQVKEVKPVTEFWTALRSYCNDRYPQLELTGSDSPKGANALWPEFRTSLRGCRVFYKSNKGCVDLEFPKYGEQIGKLHSLLDGLMDAEMSLQQTGGAAVVRIRNDRWNVSFTQPFLVHQSEIDEVLHAVSRLCGIANRLNHSDLYPIPQKE